MPDTAATGQRRDATAVADPARAERDRELVRLLQLSAAGDAPAFEAFYERSVGAAQVLARRFVRDAEVDDVLADSFFQAWREAVRFDPARGSPLGWLLTIVRTRALDQLRRRADANAASPADDGHDIEGDDPGPPDLLALAQARTRLHEALLTLSSQERWVLALAYFRDHSHADIAATTQLPLGSVKSLLLRATHKLRERLDCPTAATAPTR